MSATMAGVASDCELPQLLRGCQAAVGGRFSADWLLFYTALNSAQTGVHRRDSASRAKPVQWWVFTPSRQAGHIELSR